MGLIFRDSCAYLDKFLFFLQSLVISRLEYEILGFQGTKIWF